MYFQSLSECPIVVFSISIFNIFFTIFCFIYARNFCYRFLYVQKNCCIQAHRKATREKFIFTQSRFVDAKKKLYNKVNPTSQTQQFIFIFFGLQLPTDQRTCVYVCCQINIQILNVHLRIN